MNKLIDLLTDFENFLSKIILKVWSIICYPFVKFFTLIVPLFSKIIKFFSDLLRYLVQSIISFAQVLNSMFGPRAWNYYRHKIKNFIEQVQNEKAEKIKLKEKKNEFNEKNTKDQQTVSKKSFFDEIGLFFDAFFDRLGKISPLRFTIMGLLFLIILINSLHFFTSSNQLVFTINEDKSSEAQRSIASTLEEIPAYYNDISRLSDIKGIKIPAYTSNIDKIRSLELDATILFYNTSGKLFFDANLIIFVDHLSMTLEPVMPKFPLTPEGKMILKEKIKNEITHLLKNEGVDSEVEQVFFTNIFAN